MTTITTLTTCTTQTQGLALWWLITLDESSHQWVPARTSTVHWGCYDGRPWGGPRPTPTNGKVKDAMTHHPDSTTHVSSDTQIGRETEPVIHNQREITMCFTYFPKDPNCDTCWTTKTTRARDKNKHQKCADGTSPPTSFGDLVTADHHISTLDDESRNCHQNSLTCARSTFILDRE